MEMAECGQIKDEKIDGVIYNTLPFPDYKHGIVSGNINIFIRQGLRDSICLISMQNLYFKYHPEQI